MGGVEMLKQVRKDLLLMGVLAVAFAYRFALMTMNTFPPGADIGLHESVIKSITSGQTNFFMNYYHMGGGISATNPGYHIFAAFIITMTGLPDYLAQVLIASVFSALIVLSAFLITRQIWGELAAFTVGILVTFSIGDIVMLSWAGYPNIITLMLIPIVFYLFLQPSKISSKSYLAGASIIVSAIFLTHIFSAFVFIAITILSLLVCLLFSKKTGLSIKQAVFWLMPIGIGALMVSPYIANILPVYFGSEGNITGAVAETSQAILQTRLITLEIMGLSLVTILVFIAFFRYREGKFLSVPAVLFASWILVPILATQCYMFGMYLDYQRFLYFLSVPAIVGVGLVIASLPNALSRVAQILRSSSNGKPPKTSFPISKKTLTAVLLSVLVVGVLFTPLFALPNVGVAEANFFQLMNQSEYQAIQWVKTNTPTNAVFVTDAEFGWWLSGFAQRPTLSAVDPQYLILQHEIKPAAVARNLLTADYLIDNGLIEIEQPTAFANGSTHEISSIISGSNRPVPFFSLNDTQISILYRDKGVPQQLSLSAITKTTTSTKSCPDNASFIIRRECQSFNITEEITVFKGISYAEVSFRLKSVEGTNFDWLLLPFISKGLPVQYANSVALIDNNRQLNQIVFPENTLGSDVTMQENINTYELIYNLGNSTARASFFVGLKQLNPDLEITQPDYVNNLIESSSKNYLTKVSDLPLTCIDYQAAIQEWNISYIAIRDFTQISRFSNDPLFSLVFKNDQVAIFKVLKH
jgi:hypothetical protein